MLAENLTCIAGFRPRRLYRVASLETPSFFFVVSFFFLALAPQCPLTPVNLETGGTGEGLPG